MTSTVYYDYTHSFLIHLSSSAMVNIIFSPSLCFYRLLALSQNFQPLGVVMDTATVTIIDDDRESFFLINLKAYKSFC